MATTESTLVENAQPQAALTIDSTQTLRASKALLTKIRSDEVAQKSAAEKPDLLADADGDDAEDEVPVWLVLTTKKHIVDKKRLKPGKVTLPYPLLDVHDEGLRICIITADPQRTYKDLIAHPSFPVELGKRIQRVIGLSKLKAKYKSFESRRQLFGEYDAFLADDRIITYLPQVLGKTFYKRGSKRPIPITLEGKKLSTDEQGNKRRKLSEGGTKAIKLEIRPTDIAREVEKTVGSALIHLAPSATTAVKVGKASMEPQKLQANIEAVVQGLVDKFVPQRWPNVRAIHIKGPETAALPIYMAETLWATHEDVLEEAPPLPEAKKSKKRRRHLIDAEVEPDVLEIPGPDGKMRRIEKPHSNKNKRTTSTLTTGLDGPLVEAANAQAVERLGKEARKHALKKQKDALKAATIGNEGTEVALA